MARICDLTSCHFVREISSSYQLASDNQISISFHFISDPLLRRPATRVRRETAWSGLACRRKPQNFQRPEALALDLLRRSCLQPSPVPSMYLKVVLVVLAGCLAAVDASPFAKRGSQLATKSSNALGVNLQVKRAQAPLGGEKYL
mgnify:CR=1 FL=1